MLIRAVVTLISFAGCFCFPERTKWTNEEIDFVDGTKRFFHAVLENQTEVRLRIECFHNNEKSDEVFKFQVRWFLRRSPCSGIYRVVQSDDAFRLFDDVKALFQNEEYSDLIGPGLSATENSRVNEQVLTCGEPVILDDLTGQTPVRVQVLPAISPTKVEKPTINDDSKKGNEGMRSRRSATEKPKTNSYKVYKTESAGPHLLLLEIKALNSTQAKDTQAKGSFDVEFIAPHGYLSALDYPLLSFTAAMCIVYAGFSITWMVFGALQWQNLLRVQFWIGAVIGMGLIEQAVFLAEYEKMNETGVLYQWAEMTAEFISILKKTLARCLVLIVSLGYGLIKPRLGSLMNNVVALCMCYFLFAIVEAGLRIFQHRNDPSTKALIAAIPLSITESIICWWVFTSLMTTLKNLKLRRNIVKLTVYRHFFNTLIFCVIAAIVFMLWSIRMHKMPNCVTDWRELWIDDAYWQLLFSVMLFVIIILWRPSQNNKRYAFSPLMDDEDDEQEEPFIDTENSNFDQVKIRKNVSNGEKNLTRTLDKSEDEHLKWVEDNIPTSGFDTALPTLLDSDEEVMTTKLELSKQQ